jgi:PAS domain S-box-containing protein
VDARLAAVSAREKAVATLDSVESRQRNLLDIMTEGFVICDARGELKYVNGRFEELLGYGSGELLGIRMSDLVEADRVIDIEAFLGSLERGIPVSAEIMWVRKDGARVPTLVSAKPKSGPDGHVAESFAVITDVTVLKDVEGRLRQREQDLMKEAASLEELNTALKVLLEKREQDAESVKSGLLRQLGTLVLPYLDKLRGSGLEERQRKLADTIDSNLAGLTSRMASELGAHSAGLTSAEEQVMGLVRDGKQTKEIAEILGVSRRTVEFHRSNIRKKLGMKGKGGDLRTRA